MEVEDNSNIYFIEFTNLDRKQKLDIVYCINSDGLTIHKINRKINNTNTKSLKLYGFHGLEITEESDLDVYKNDQEKNKIIFFSRKNEIFNNQEILNVFKIEKKILDDSYFFSFIGCQKFTNEKFIIKLIKPQLANIEYYLTESELARMKKIHHPNIAKLHKYCFLNDKTVVLIYEYYTILTLRDYLKFNRKFNEDEFKPIFRQILEIVEYFHNHEIIHTDLKPEHIVFDENKSIKITDFNLNSIKYKKKDLHHSFNYKAPELIEELYDIAIPQNDIWSLGLILYEMISGETLFPGKNTEVIQKINNKNLIIYPLDFSLELQDLLTKILIKDDNKRIKLEDILDHPWILGEKLKPVEKIPSPILAPTKLEEKTLQRKSSSLENLIIKYNKIKHILVSKKDILSEINESLSKEKIIEYPQKLKKKYTSSVLPKIKTKLPSNINENEVCDYNISLLKNPLNKAPTYLDPIGHTKGLKQKLVKIKDFFESLTAMKNVFDAANESNPNSVNRKTEKKYSTNNASSKINLEDKTEIKRKIQKRYSSIITYSDREKLKLLKDSDKNLININNSVEEFKEPIKAPEELRDNSKVEYLTLSNPNHKFKKSIKGSFSISDNRRLSFQSKIPYTNRFSQKITLLKDGMNIMNL